MSINPLSIFFIAFTALSGYLFVGTNVAALWGLWVGILCVMLVSARARR